jgi:hypothetical protein
MGKIPINSIFFPQTSKRILKELYAEKVAFQLKSLLLPD